MGAQRHDEVQPTVASVFGRMVDPIGVPQPQVQRITRSKPTVGGESVPVVTQSGVTAPNREMWCFLAFWGSQISLRVPFFSSETHVFDSYVTRRSNASGRTSRILHQA